MCNGLGNGECGMWILYSLFLGRGYRGYEAAQRLPRTWTLLTGSAHSYSDVGRAQGTSAKALDKGTTESCGLYYRGEQKRPMYY
jgi:hypothetical protein